VKRFSQWKICTGGISPRGLSAESWSQVRAEFKKALVLRSQITDALASSTRSTAAA